MKKIVKIWIFTIALFVFIALVTTASASTITVDDDLNECPYANYTSIQPAINNATSGDIILVYNGTYRENVVVNRTLNLTGIGMPIIDGMKNGNVMDILSNDCTIENFKITNGSYAAWDGGAVYINSQDNTIKNNSISCNTGTSGILIGGRNNTICFNTITSNSEGIHIFDTYGYDGEENIIYSNYISGNSKGIYFETGKYNAIYSNNISGNSFAGLYLWSANNNNIYENTISSNSRDGIYIWGSSGNEISRNEITENGKGLEIWISSSGNVISKNNISSNNYGTYIYYPSYASNNNLFYHSNFIENSENNTWDECSNYWYNSSLEEGNYYDDYEGMDEDEDGIGDTPYNISGGANQDLYPLMKPYAENKPPVASFTYYPENPVVNQTITFNASSSYDPDGNITAYEWEFGDGANATGEIVNHSYSSAGNYTVNLTVTDDRGAKNSTSEIVEVVDKTIFDTGEPENPYPSIFGTHNGTIKPYKDIYVEKMFSYPCAGTGGHSEFVRIWGNGLNESASWNGYTRDWHNISFDAPFTLKANLTYNYTIRTGSYPQIIHVKEFNATGGTITCSAFIDANGKVYNNWIPAIKLFL